MSIKNRIMNRMARTENRILAEKVRIKLDKFFMDLSLGYLYGKECRSKGMSIDDILHNINTGKARIHYEVVDLEGE